MGECGYCEADAHSGEHLKGCPSAPKKITSYAKHKIALEQILELTLSHKGPSMLFAAEIHNIAKKALGRR